MSARSLRPRKAEASKYFAPESDDGGPSLSSKKEPTSDSDSLTQESEEEPPMKKSKVTARKGSIKTSPKQIISKNRLSRGKKEASGEEEPWETFIPKEATPDSGDVPYDNAKIHPNTLEFLKGTIKFD
jgi:hypothetical protein